MLWWGVVALITIPVTLVVRSRPEDLGIQPDGLVNGGYIDGNLRGPTKIGTRDFTVKESVSTRAFWCLLVGLALRVSVADVIVIHQIPMMVWKGVSEQTAALYMSIAFALMIPHRLNLGVAAYYVAPREILSIAMALRSLVTI